MSQVPYPAPQQQPGTNMYVQQQAPTNGLGIAGFVTSLIGVVTCGFLSPVGLLFSLIGLTKRPRGLAIAGTVLGLLGSIWLFAVGFALVMGFLGLSKAVTAVIEVENTRQKGRQAAQVIEQERDRTGSLPGEAAGNKLIASQTDHWNRPFRYKVSGDSFSLMSFGADGQEGTADDINFTESELRAFEPTTSPADGGDADADPDAVELDTSTGDDAGDETGTDTDTGTGTGTDSDADSDSK